VRCWLKVPLEMGGIVSHVREGGEVEEGSLNFSYLIKSLRNNSVLICGLSLISTSNSCT
jgi:hypothetical protein